MITWTQLCNFFKIPYWIVKSKCGMGAYIFIELCKGAITLYLSPLEDSAKAQQWDLDPTHTKQQINSQGKMTNLHDSIALHSSWVSLKHTGTYGSNYIPEHSPSHSGFRGLKGSWQNHANSWFQGAGCPSVIPFCFVPQLYHKGFVPPRKYWTERIIGIQDTHVFYQQTRRKCNHILEGRWFLCVFCNSAFSKMTSALWVTTNSGGRICKRK